MLRYSVYNKQKVRAIHELTFFFTPAISGTVSTLLVPIAPPFTAVVIVARASRIRTLIIYYSIIHKLLLTFVSYSIFFSIANFRINK